MATILSYADLQTALNDQLHRSDFDEARAIQLTEAKVNRALEDQAQEVRVTATAAEYMTFPSDYLMLRRIQVNSPKSHFLDIYTPAYASFISSPSGVPKFYTLEDDQIRLIPAPDGDYEVEMTYYQFVPALSVSNTSNWLLAKHPDIYLYGGCFEACAELRDTEGAQGYKALFNDEMGGLIHFQRKQKWAGGPLMIRPG